MSDAEEQMTRRAQELAARLVEAMNDPEADAEREAYEEEKDRRASEILAAYHANRKRPDSEPPIQKLLDSADELRSYLLFRGIDHEKTATGARIRFRMGGPTEYTIDIEWTSDRIRLTAPSGLEVPESRREEVAKVIAGLNVRSEFPVWRMGRNPEAVAVAFHDGGISSLVFDEYLSLLKDNLGRGIPALKEALGLYRQAPILLARSSHECRLYMELHPCECGNSGPLEHKGVIQGDHGLTARYEGACPQCGRARQFDFVLDPEIPAPDSFGGDRPSRIICPGQFMLYSDSLASGWPADPAQIPSSNRDRAREDLALAIRACEEVLKFISPIQDAVPQNSFSSSDGRAYYQKEPGRFRAARMQAVLDVYRDLLQKLDSAP